MKWRDMIYFALCSIGSSLLRSLLTILGFAVGVGAVLTVLTLGDAGEIRVEAEIAKLGVNKVWVRQRDNTGAFTADDAALLSLHTGAPACASAFTFASVTANGRIGNVQITGMDERMQEVQAFRLMKGRMFNRREYQQGNLVCLIDENLADAYDDLGIGSSVFVANRRFIVVGIIKTLAGQNIAGSSGLMLLPLSAYLTTFDSNISEIILHVPSGQNAESVAEKALATISPSGAFRTETLEEEINAAREVIRIFVTVLMAVAAVCMLSGGIGVMNVLVLTVRERRHEIGMLKSIGGTSIQICLLFLAESVTYALLGGGMGIILGNLMIQCCGVLIGISGQVRFLHLAEVLLTAMLLGLGFGVLPAAMAARMTPVEALRSE